MSRGENGKEKKDLTGKWRYRQEVSRTSVVLCVSRLRSKLRANTKKTEDEEITNHIRTKRHNDNSVSQTCITLHRTQFVGE